LVGALAECGEVGDDEDGCSAKAGGEGKYFLERAVLPPAPVEAKPEADGEVGDRGDAHEEDEVDGWDRCGDASVAQERSDRQGTDPASDVGCGVEERQQAGSPAAQ